MSELIYRTGEEAKQFNPGPEFRLYVIHCEDGHRVLYVWARNPVDAAGAAMREWGYAVEMWERLSVPELMQQLQAINVRERHAMRRALGLIPPKRRGRR